MPQPTAAPEPVAGTRIALISISEIDPNPLQPRTILDAGKAPGELANSIETHGIVQPILIRIKDSHFELIAGERRLRAAKLAGLAESSSHYSRLRGRPGA